MSSDPNTPRLLTLFGAHPGRCRWLVAALVFVGGASVPRTANAQQPLTDGQRITELRLDVDELAAQVRAEREQLNRARERLSAETLELELALGRAQARLDVARQRRDEVRREAEASKEEEQALTLAVLATTERLEAMVESGLPFRVDDRLDALATVRNDLRGGRVPPNQSAIRLWRFIREELQLSQTAGLAREILEVQGDRRLVEVARLGMVGMLFRLPDGRVGYLEPVKDGGYRAALAITPEVRDAIGSVFTSLSGGRGPGRFEVPAGSLVQVEP